MRAIFGFVLHLRKHWARKLRALTSPYEASMVKLLPISSGPRSRAYVVAVSVRLNGKTVKLMLDTGASGISVSPK